MNNIFKNAYFGKAYKTRDGRMTIYLRKMPDNNDFHEVLVSDLNLEHFHSNGQYCEFPLSCDIISEWQEPIVCKCQWKDYYDYRIMLPNGEGHVRVSFFEDEILISDLYVSEEHRHKGYATILLDKVDELLNNKTATIYALEEWQQKWYERRGYTIGKEESLDEERLDKSAKKYADKYAIPNTFQHTTMEAAYKNGYKQAIEEQNDL